MLSSSNPVCQETAGFLFSHPCKNPATQTCSRCGKAICTDHMRTVDASLLSPGTGATEEGQPSPSPGGMSAVCIACRRQMPAPSQEQGDDPFFYSSYAYGDYSEYDGVDRYTRADRQAFDTPEGTAEGSLSGAEAEAWEGDFDAS